MPPGQSLNYLQQGLTVIDPNDFGTQHNYIRMNTSTSSTADSGGYHGYCLQISNRPPMGDAASRMEVT